MFDDNPGVNPLTTRLIEAFKKLPGVGPKNARRLAFYTLTTESNEALELAEAITAARQGVQLCEVCMNLAEGSRCTICSDEARDVSIICVVESPSDVFTLEQSRSYSGLYHVLHGVLSPMNGIGPNDLKFDSLLKRLEGSGVKEIIIATNPNLEGDATANYLQGLLDGHSLSVTRIARGLPSGSVLEFADESSLGYALRSRERIND